MIRQVIYPQTTSDRELASCLAYTEILINTSKELTALTAAQSYEITILYGVQQMLECSKDHLPNDKNLSKRMFVLPPCLRLIFNAL
jgi:hypothetical protein